MPLRRRLHRVGGGPAEQRELDDGDRGWNSLVGEDGRRVAPELAPHDEARQLACCTEAEAKHRLFDPQQDVDARASGLRHLATLAGSASSMQGK